MSTVGSPEFDELIARGQARAAEAMAAATPEDPAETRIDDRLSNSGARSSRELLAERFGGDVVEAVIDATSGSQPHTESAEDITSKPLNTREIGKIGLARSRAALHEARQRAAKKDNSTS